MISQLKLILIFALVLVGADLSSVVRAQDLPNSEKQKIETLIKQVASLKDAKFVRNGSTYNADSAAIFLRRKWRANESEVRTAQDHRQSGKLLVNFGKALSNPVQGR